MEVKTLTQNFDVFDRENRIHHVYLDSHGVLRRDDGRYASIECETSWRGCGQIDQARLNREAFWIDQHIRPTSRYAHQHSEWVSNPQPGDVSVVDRCIVMANPLGGWEKTSVVRPYYAYPEFPLDFWDNTVRPTRWIRNTELSRILADHELKGEELNHDELYDEGVRIDSSQSQKIIFLGGEYWFTGYNLELSVTELDPFLTISQNYV